jgi:hypothetical protein
MKILEDLQNSNLFFIHGEIKAISIYDHHTYDRSDYDSLSPPQRQYLLDRLSRIGFKQKSGRTCYHEKEDITVIFPKPNILGGSPFDVIRYEKKAANIVYALTPTQAFCLLLNQSDEKESLTSLKELIQAQPVNIKKIKDYVRTESQLKDRFDKFYPELLQLEKESEQVHRAAGKAHLGKIL